MKKVVVLMGGMSSERMVSFESGKCVLKALLSRGYNAMALDVQQPISGLVQALEQMKPDVVFNALHGRYGEDGCIQGLLNMMQIPYTHSDVLASAISMDKQQTKLIASQLGIDVPNGRLVTLADIKQGNTLPKPYVLKPNDEGSSVGVYIIRTKEDEKSFLFERDIDKIWLMEEYIEGREMSVVVTDKGVAGIVEIIPNEGFYDYKHKYTQGAATHVIPAQLTEQQAEKLGQDSCAIHRILGCRQVSRSDFRLDEKTNRCVFLELNANPGMTSLSLVPEVLQIVQGISYTDFVVQLVESAVNRQE